MKRKTFLKIALPLLIALLALVISETDPWQRFRYRAYLPPAAQEIRIWREGVPLFSTRLEWQCRISEEAFLAWSESRRYPLRKSSANSTPINWYNVNPHGGNMFGSSNFLCIFRRLPLGYFPYDYYFYNDRDDDARGITLLYDRAGGQLFGSFHSR